MAGGLGRMPRFCFEGQANGAGVFAFKFMNQATVTMPEVPAAAAGASAMERLFRNPPASHAPVPFYWWAGERLERGRIAWQLDQLVAAGVRQTIISYPHHPDGSNDPGDPPLFSPEWWDLFRWFLGECRKRGMTAGFQDYTIVEPILQSIGRATPGMQGGQLSCTAGQVGVGGTIRLAAEAGARVIAARAYPLADGVPRIDGSVSLDTAVVDGGVEWTAPAGDWFVALVFVRPSAFDPLHPQSGELAIGELYAPFERECPGEVGRTLNLFFQDELDFGCRMPFWSEHLPEAFCALKGYDLLSVLPALWHDMGDSTEKIRIDYADAVTRRLEDCYFKPVFAWHEERGTLFGHDNSGRGRIAQGRSFYGDYFRAMRWYSAPGCDDPKLHGARAFKGLKVNSSIAQLYERPRVWIEAFHSSGWGTSPADVVAAIQEDFAYGATVVNLHGLYYSTFGGWWEWAPPDFHFRQPYWQHAQSLNGFFTRLCHLLSQGTRRCDVGIVYPVTALDAEAADPAPAHLVAHMANESLDGPESPQPRPEDGAFQLGKHLFDHGCDFDFVDFESIERAVSSEGGLHVAGGAYRVLVFPAMRVLRFSTLEKAHDFVRSGGVVIAYGCLPAASDRAGRNDGELDVLVTAIFGAGDDGHGREKSHPGGGKAFFIPHGRERVLAAVNGSIVRDVLPDRPLQVLHRHLGDREVYYLFNAADQPVETRVVLRDSGRAELWNAWTGETEPLSLDVPLRFAARESKLVVLDPAAVPVAAPSAAAGSGSVLAALDGSWDFEIVPTLDNRFGDFSLPATAELLGPQARRFEYADEIDGEALAWRETTHSFGPRLEVSAAVPPGTDFSAVEAALLAGEDVLAWEPYAFSLRWGIERDPFLTDWLSGPHGLKCRVPDEFLDFHSEVPGTTWYLRAKVIAPRAGSYRLLAGARSIYEIWINGVSAVRQDEALPPGLYAPWNIPHYECVPRESSVELREGENDLLIKLVQPEGQRTRAFFAFDPPGGAAAPLTLRWFTDPAAPRPSLPAPAERRAIRFRMATPPGMQEFAFIARGPARAWIGDIEIPLTPYHDDRAGQHGYLGRLSAPLPESATLTLRIEAPRESRAGDALPEPVRFDCGAGRIPLGDWSLHGLATYSGMAVYRKSFIAPELPPGAQAWLDLGQLSATAEVRINGRIAATLIAPPWQCEVTPFLVPGENQVSVTVANTLANHYRVGIPTPYAFEHQTPSGLFGPVQCLLKSC